MGGSNGSCVSHERLSYKELLNNGRDIRALTKRVLGCRSADTSRLFPIFEQAPSPAVESSLNEHYLEELGRYYIN